MSVKVPDRIASLPVYVPGKPIEAVAREYNLATQSIAKLASNENPLGAPKEVRERLASILSEIHIYPDGAALSLRSRIADKHEIDPAWIVVGNGSAEIIEMAVRAFLDVGEHTLASKHAFAIAKCATLATNHEYREVAPNAIYGNDTNTLLRSIQENTKVIYLSNPNNPTGAMLSAKELDAFVEQVPERILIVIDEAYYEYLCTNDFPDSLAYLRAGRKNVLVLRTFSKIYGLAGLRIGYGFAHPEIVAGIEKVRSPFNTNLMAQHAAIAALACPNHVRDSATLANQECDFLRHGLSKLDLQVFGNGGNFVMCDVKKDAAKVFAALQARGVIVRPLGGYALPTFIRVSAGLRTENQKFLTELANVLTS